MTGILMMSVGNSYGSLPVNTVAPVVSGTVTVGSTLSTTNGTWTGAPAPTFTYQWQRSGSNISGATSNTYVIQSADVGSTLRCVVTATNPLGAVSANSNSTGTVPAVTGQIEYTSPGTYTYVVPAGVTSISMVVVGGGGGGGAGADGGWGNGGAGGGLAYLNNYSVTPGTSATVTVGSGGSGAVGVFLSSSATPATAGGASEIVYSGVTLVRATGGQQGQNTSSVGSSSPRSGGTGSGTSGAVGRSGGSINPGSYEGGAGAAGYSGNGGSVTSGSPQAGSGGGGGAGGFWSQSFGKTGENLGGGGGGVGLLGEGANGAAGNPNQSGANPTTTRGGGGSGGATAGANSTNLGGSGGAFGGGGGGLRAGGQTSRQGGAGGVGGVRIIWPGTTRAYPSTNTGNL